MESLEAERDHIQRIRQLEQKLKRIKDHEMENTEDNQNRNKHKTKTDGNRNRKDDKELFCIECDRTFTTAWNLKSHIQNMHERNIMHKL